MKILLVILAITLVTNTRAGSQEQPRRDAQQGGNDRPDAGRDGEDGGRGGDPPPPPPDAPPPPPRVWAFALVRNNPPFNALDPQKRTVSGLSLDVMRAACEVAHQQCDFIYLKSFIQCWDNEKQFSAGLANRWFDGCSSSFHTFERDLVNGFSIPYSDEVPSALYVRRNDNLRGEDIRNSNDFAFGFIRDWWLNKACLDYNGVSVDADRMRLYSSQDQLMQALRNSEIRVVLAVKLDAVSDDFKEVGSGQDIKCALAGTSVMMRKDNHELLHWLNPALQQVMTSHHYRSSCYVWEKIFGLSAHCLEGSAVGRGY